MSHQELHAGSESGSPRRTTTPGRRSGAGAFLLLLAVVLLAAGVGAAGARAGGASKSPTWIKYWAPADPADAFSGGLMTRAGTGDLYVSGVVSRYPGGTDDWCVVRYAASGARKWQRALRTAGQSRVFAVAADATGRVALVGYVATPSHSGDWMVAVWDRSGHLLWKRQIDGTAHDADTASACAFDRDGSLVVAGNIMNASTFSDGLAVKYSSAGKELWRHRMDGPAHMYDAATAVAVDAKGFAYVAGYTFSAVGGDDAVLMRLSTKGKLLWTVHRGVAEKSDRFEAVAVHGGYVACAGHTKNDAVLDNWEDRGLVAYYRIKNGSLKWAQTLSNPTDPLRDASWTLVGMDGKGRVAVAGWYASTDVPGDRAWDTTVYSAAGVQGTLQQLQGTNGYDNVPLALVSTEAGTVYETGSVADTTDNRDLYVIALDPTGAAKWSSSIKGSSGEGQGLAVTSTGLYVAGQTITKLQLLKFTR